MVSRRATRRLSSRHARCLERASAREGSLARGVQVRQRHELVHRWRVHVDGEEFFPEFGLNLGCFGHGKGTQVVAVLWHDPVATSFRRGGTIPCCFMASDQEREYLCKMTVRM